MNIIMITNTFIPHVGGVARSVSAFTEAYREQGHRVLVIAPEFDDMPEDEKDVIRIPSIQHFHGSDFSIRFPTPLFLSRYLNRFQPDIIHSHHPFMLGGSALLIAEEYDIPLIFTYHTMYEQYTHYVPGDSPRLKRFVAQLAIGYSNLCDHIFVPSESIQTILKKRGLKQPSTVVPTGVDIKRFACGNGDQLRQELGISKNTFVVGHVGRLAPEKNLEFLTSSVQKFLRKNENAYCLVVGQGPSRPTMEHLFEQEGIRSRVRFLGIAKGDRLVDAYHAMDVFAFASQTETQGMVLTEAMASGVPVVAIDAPGAREVIENGRNGRLVKKENSGLFFAALNWIQELPERERNRLKSAALATARKFSMAATSARSLKIYAQHTAGLQKSARNSIWRRLARIVETEWDIWRNWTHAATKALCGKNGSSRIS